MTRADLKTLAAAVAIGALVMLVAPAACELAVGRERNSERPGETR